MGESLSGNYLLGFRSSLLADDRESRLGRLCEQPKHIDITLYGVQTFQYRGERRFSRPGKIIVIHPDELHDGGAGTEDGLRYRMLYLEPALLHQALPVGSELPFMADPVITDKGLVRTLIYCLEGLNVELQELAADQLVADLAPRCRATCNAPGRLERSSISRE